MRNRERGFTLIDVMISLGVTTVALAAVLGLYNTAARANRQSDVLTRGTRYGEQLMERLRGMKVSEIQALAQPGDVVSSRVAYHRSFTVADLAGQANLVLVTVTVTYGEDGDESAAGLHTLVLQSLRTKVEQF